jgi:hypothetical protein
LTRHEAHEGGRRAMATERVDFVAHIDLRQVDTALDRTRAKTDEAIVGKGRLAGALERVEKASNRTAQQGLGSLSFALGGTAGQAANAMNALGDIAELLRTGGKGTIALAAATVGVTLLQKAWDEHTRAAREAREAGIKAAKDVADAVNNATKTLENQLLSAVSGITDETLLKVRALENEKKILEIELNAIGAGTGEATFLQKIFGNDEVIKAKERLAGIREELNKLGPAIGRFRTLRGLVPTASEVSGATGGSGGSGGSGATAGPTDAGDFIDQLEVKWREQNARRIAEIERERAEDAEMAWQAGLREIEIAQQVEDERTDALKRAAEERARLREEESRRAQEQAAAEGEFYAGIAMSVATTSAKLAVAGAQGQKQALVAVLAEAADAAGGFIMLEGGKVFAAGVGGALLGNPAAPGQIAGGLALIGLGAAVQQGGPAVISSLAGSTAASAGGGRAARDPGVNSGGGGRSGGRSSGGDGFGGLTVNVNYAVGGPPPEDTAREIVNAIDLARRRRLTA